MALSGTIGLATATTVSAAASITDTVQMACNNSFNAAKFPFDYRIVATPSANPVAPGSTFTVKFDVTVIASAGFLNAVYKLLGAIELPITADKATIAPLRGATGPAVQVVMPATFTIPKPATAIVTAGQEIPLGSITGTYTAGASGDIAFTVLGNAFAPATGSGAAALPADPLPSGVTTAGWSTLPVTQLTTTGKQTYSQASLLSGAIKPYLICMGGQWTITGTVDTPVIGLPWKPDTTGFAKLTIGSAPATTLPATTVPVTTTPATTTPRTVPPTTLPPTTLPATTAPATTAPATTAPATTVPATDPGTTTPATDPATTVPSTDPATTPPTTSTPAGEEITGTAAYETACEDSVANGKYTLTFDGVVTAVSPVAAGGSVTITGQEWDVTIPADLATTLASLLGTEFDADMTLTLAATNASPAEATSASTKVRIVVESGADSPNTVTIPDITFTATGNGPVTVTLKAAVTTVMLGGSPVNLTCNVSGTPEQLIQVESFGTPIATTTTVAGGGGATTTVASGGSGGGGGGGGGGGRSLGGTGSALANTWYEIFIALGVLQMGLFLWSFSSRRSRRRA